MATNLTCLVNKTNGSVNYATTPANFILLDLTNDYLIWSAGSAAVADGEDEPTPSELTAAATKISTSQDVEVAHCIAYDDSDGIGTLREIDGMNENKRFVFGFSFDGATASEPQLEAWDDDNHDSTDNHVLGNGTPASSMLKGVCTTNSLPGASWVGSALSGASNVILLNDGNGALDDLESGESSQELYANLRIVVPQSYASPASESFILTTRFSYA